MIIDAMIKFDGGKTNDIKTLREKDCEYYMERYPEKVVEHGVSLEVEEKPKAGIPWSKIRNVKLTYRIECGKQIVLSGLRPLYVGKPQKNGAYSTRLIDFAAEKRTVICSQDCKPIN
jgi:hypothetical protein